MEPPAQYLGGVVAFAGLCLSGAFVGRPRAPPLASNFVELTTWTQLGGALCGFAVVAVGLVLVARYDPAD